MLLKEEQLVNDDGLWYGVHVTVCGTDDVQEALGALVEKYGEDRVYGSSDMLDQFQWSIERSE